MFLPIFYTLVGARVKETMLLANEMELDHVDLTKQLPKVRREFQETRQENIGLLAQTRIINPLEAALQAGYIVEVIEVVEMIEGRNEPRIVEDVMVLHHNAQVEAQLAQFELKAALYNNKQLLEEGRL